MLATTMVSMSIINMELVLRDKHVDDHALDGYIHPAMLNVAAKANDKVYKILDLLLKCISDSNPEPQFFKNKHNKRTEYTKSNMILNSFSIMTAASSRSGEYCQANINNIGY